MIRRIVFLLSLIVAITFISPLFAQIAGSPSIQVAYVNTTELLEAVPGKTAAAKTIEELNKKYKDELAVMQNDYNNKYTDFLSNQNVLAESIKLRRMQELYELEQSINRFMKVAQEDVESQEMQLIEPLRSKLKEAIHQVGVEQGYICIYDLADPTIVFLTPDAIDANSLVKAKLRKL